MRSSTGEAAGSPNEKSTKKNKNVSAEELKSLLEAYKKALLKKEADQAKPFKCRPQLSR